MSAVAELVFNDELEPETLTDREETKELPCRVCGRRCIVTRFASPHKTECNTCRSTPKTRAGGRTAPEPVAFEFDEGLETERVVGEGNTLGEKEVPCVECGRRCIVTKVATPAKVRCNTCVGHDQAQKREKVQVERAKIMGDPSRLANLTEALINPPFKHVVCPVHPDDEEHEMEIISVVHNDNYGPSEFVGWKGGKPEYRQIAPGESVMYQCRHCLARVTYDTTCVVRLRPINEVRVRDDTHIPLHTWITMNGAKVERGGPLY